MQIYFGLAAWGVVAFAIYKVINLVLAKRQLAGKQNSADGLMASSILCFFSNLTDFLHSQSQRNWRI
jgi:hypothetical protein